MRKVLAILALIATQGAHAQLIANPGVLPSNTLVPGNCVQATGSNSVDTSPAAPCLTTTAAAGLYLPLTGGTLTGPLTVAGTVSATSGGSATLFSGANYGGVTMTDPTQTANNRTWQWINFTGSFQARAVSDSGASATTVLAISGGQGGGITGITSNSGSGAWSHTGAMNVSGQLSANPVQGAGYNWLNIAGAANGSSPSITTGGGNTNVSLSINTKGAGGVTINANTAVTGNLSAGSATITGGAAVGSSLTVGSTTPAVVATGEQAFAKITASGTAPGVGFLKLAATAGTTAGTCKIIAYAGTSTTPVTIVDNVGSGC
jgi:hypothetical protein